MQSTCFLNYQSGFEPLYPINSKASLGVIYDHYYMYENKNTNKIKNKTKSITRTLPPTTKKSDWWWYLIINISSDFSFYPLSFRRRLFPAIRLINKYRRGQMIPQLNERKWIWNSVGHQNRERLWKSIKIFIMFTYSLAHQTVKLLIYHDHMLWD